MFDCGTEAEHLSEIYDDCCLVDFEPYSKAERAEYVRAKNLCFKKSDIGKYVVAQTARKKKSVVKLLYLVNRNICKRFWWSHDAFYAMIFENKEAAERVAKRYKYNNTRVLQIKQYMADQEWFREMYDD